MHFQNGMVYGDEPVGLKIVEVEPREDMTMLVTFESGEKRLYDASRLLEYPVFAPLADAEVFMHPVLDHGVVTWKDGQLDISPESMYENSGEYTERA